MCIFASESQDYMLLKLCNKDKKLIFDKKKFSFQRWSLNSTTEKLPSKGTKMFGQDLTCSAKLDGEQFKFTQFYTHHCFKQIYTLKLSIIKWFFPNQSKIYDYFHSIIFCTNIQVRPLPKHIWNVIKFNACCFTIHFGGH